MEANAEAALRDDGPLMTDPELRGPAIAAGLVTVAASGRASPLHAEIAVRLADLIDANPLVIEAAHDHEIYVTAAEVLADLLATRGGGGRWGGGGGHPDRAAPLRLRPAAGTGSGSGQLGPWRRSSSTLDMAVGGRSATRRCAGRPA